MLQKNGTTFNFLDCVFDDVFISFNLDYTLCYQIEGLPFDLMEASRYKETHIRMMDALNVLDPHIVVSSVIRNRSEYRPILERHFSYMKEETPWDTRKKEWMKKSFQNTRAIEHYLFFTHKKPLEPWKRFNPFRRPRIKYTESEHVQRKAHLKRHADAFLSDLSSIGMRWKPMSVQEVVDYGYYHLNHTDNPHTAHTGVYVTMDDQTVFRAQKSLRDQMLESEILPDVSDGKKHYPNCMKIGNRFVTVFSVDILGRLSDRRFYDKLSHILPEDHTYMVTLERVENKTLFDLIERNERYSALTRSAKIASGGSDKESPATPLHSSEGVLEDGRHYLMDAEELNLRSFKFSISWTVESHDPGELQERVRHIQTKLRQNEFYDTRVVINPGLIPYHYHSFIPGNAHLICDWVYNNTLSVLYYLPFQADVKGYDIFDDSKPTNQIYLNRKNEIVKYHTFYFDQNFKHHEITASTGSGKTADLVKQIDGILSEKQTSTMSPIIMAIEPKKGFAKLCAYYKGEIIEYNFSGDKSYNPFFRKQEVLLEHDEKTHDPATSAYNPLLLEYMSGLLEKLSVDERHQSIPNRIKRVFEDSLISLYDAHEESYIPVLLDIVDALGEIRLENSEFTNELSRVRKNLAFYCSERFHTLFGRRETLDISNDFLYFDLGNVDANPHLKHVIMYSLSSAIMRKLRIRNRVKYLFIDEASVFHKSKEGAEMIDYFLRLGRSRAGVIVLASQNVSDGIDSLASKTIKNALAVETCMWLKDGHKELLDLGYTSYETKAILNLQKKPGHFVELFRKFNGSPMVLKSVTNPYLYWLSTTDPQDDVIFERYRNQFKDLDLKALIEKLAEDYPHGHYAAAY